jgi:hypothetical protein
MKAVYHGAENWRELHQQDLIAAGLLPAPIPVTAPLPASEGTPRTDAVEKGAGVRFETWAGYYGLMRDFARTLERELADAKEPVTGCIEEAWRADAGWARAGELERNLSVLRTLLATAENKIAEFEKYRRFNIEKTDDGYRICEGTHDKHESCEFVEYVPASRLATDEKERENLREYVGAQLYMSDFSTADQLRAAYEELRARLTPSASQSAEMEKRAIECAKAILTADLPAMSSFLTPGQCNDARVAKVAAIIANRFTTPTQ